MTSGYVSLVVPLAAAIVAVVQIARAGAVPHRMRWLPLIALVVVALPQVAQQIVGVAFLLTANRTLTGGYVPTTDPLMMVSMDVLGPLGVLCTVVAVGGLGVVAIVAGLEPRRSAEASVPVFSSTDAGPQSAAGSEEVIVPERGDDSS